LDIARIVPVARHTCDILAASGPLQPGFPAKILEFYFSQLFVDLPADLTDRVGR